VGGLLEFGGATLLPLPIFLLPRCCSLAAALLLF